MIRNILLIGLAGLLNLSLLEAQTTTPLIQVNLDDFNVEELSNSEQLLINILVNKEVQKLEEEIRYLNNEKQFGRISDTEYNEKKKLASEKITDKIGRSIDILTNTEYGENEDLSLISTVNETDTLESDSTLEEKRRYKYINFKSNTIKDRREYYIGFKDNSTTPSKDTTLHATSISANIGFGFANWMNEDNSRYDDPIKKLSGSSSWYYELGFKANSYIDKKRVKSSIDYGISIVSRYYHFNNPQFSVNDQNHEIRSIENVQMTESVFSQTALEFPVSFTHRFTNNLKERFAISAGVYGGINLRSRQKIKYSVNNKDYKAKWISDFNTNRFYAGAKASIGYNSVYLIARYNFTTLFKASSDIEVNPYSIGISFGL